jgi:hypothetical protein
MRTLRLDREDAIRTRTEDSNPLAMREKGASFSRWDRIERPHDEVGMCACHEITRNSEAN